MLSVFDYIREINKIPSDILSPAKFKILVELVMRVNDTSATWPKNKELSFNTAIKPNSIKVLLSQLKKDRFIHIEKCGGKRSIYLCHPIEKKRLTVIIQNGKKVMQINEKVTGINQGDGLTDINQGDKIPINNDKTEMLMGINQDNQGGKKRLIEINQNEKRLIKINPKVNEHLPRTYYIEDNKKIILKENSAASPDSFIHPELDSILEKIPYKKFKRSSLNACLIQQGEAYINYLLRVSESADHPEWYFRGGILGYYRGYLDSPEYAAADFKLRGGDYDN